MDSPMGALFFFAVIAESPLVLGEKQFLLKQSAFDNFRIIDSALICKIEYPREMGDSFNL
jgi:hypothetical protein